MSAGSFANRLAVEEVPDGVLVAVDLLLQLTPAAATVSTTSATSGFRKPSVARLLMRSSPIHKSCCQRDEIVACDGCPPRLASDDRAGGGGEEQVHEAGRGRAGLVVRRAGLLVGLDHHLAR